jgi:hypothetical protein
VSAIPDRVSGRVGAQGQIEADDSADRGNEIHGGVEDLAALEPPNLRVRHTYGRSDVPLTEAGRDSRLSDVEAKSAQSRSHQAPAAVRGSLTCSHGDNLRLRRLSGTCLRGATSPDARPVRFWNAPCSKRRTNARSRVGCTGEHLIVRQLERPAFQIAKERAIRAFERAIRARRLSVGTPHVPERPQAGYAHAGPGALEAAALG